MNKKSSALIVLSFLIFIAYTSPLLAVGLQVKPAKVILETKKGELASARLTVFNSSEEVALFEVFPDDFITQIKISPASFILESGEFREVSASFSFRESGRIQTNLSVRASPLSKRSFNAIGGVKIPVEITIIKKTNFGAASAFMWLSKNKNALVGLAAFLMILFILFTSYRFLFTKNKKESSEL